jgi:hypothetical protein
LAAAASLVTACGDKKQSCAAHALLAPVSSAQQCAARPQLNNAHGSADAAARSPCLLPTPDAAVWFLHFCQDPADGKVHSPASAGPHRVCGFHDGARVWVPATGAVKLLRPRLGGKPARKGSAAHKHTWQHARMRPSSLAAFAPDPPFPQNRNPMQPPSETFTQTASRAASCTSRRW